MGHKNKGQEENEDIRVSMTSRLWGMTIGMLAISIPLSDVTESAIIPLAVIAGATIGTVAIWVAGGKPKSAVAESDTTAQNRIKELEERLANLETINNFERRLAEDALARQAPVSPANIPIGEVVQDRPAEPTTTSSEASRVSV